MSVETVKKDPQLEKVILEKGIGEDVRTKQMEIFLSERFNTQAETDKTAFLRFEHLKEWANKHKQDLPYGGFLRLFLSDYEGLKRLSELHQLGIQQDPKDFKGFGTDSSRKDRLSHHPGTFFYDHRRLTHVLLVADTMLEITERDGLPIEIQDKAAAAALIHDDRHAALSHLGDQLVDTHFGTTHEQRGANELPQKIRRLWPESKDIEELEQHISFMTDIIIEKSLLGKVLDIADLISYLRVDMLEANLKDLIPDILFHFGENITLNEERGILEVNKAGKFALIGLLNQRAQAYGLLYCHPLSLIKEAIQREGIAKIIKLGGLSIEDLRDKTDSDIYNAILYQILDHPSLEPYFTGFSPSERGYVPIMAISNPVEFERKRGITITDYLRHEFGMMDTTADDVFIVAYPYDRFKKKIAVLNLDTGAVESLHATNQRQIHSLEDKAIVCCLKIAAKAISDYPMPSFD